MATVSIVCKECGNLFEHTSHSGRRPAYCKECSKTVPRIRAQRKYAASNNDKKRASVRAWQETHREETRAYTAARRVEGRAFIDAIKDAPCMDCGQRFPPYVMDFDHRDPNTKLFSIGESGPMRARDALEAEIAKCDVVCANCHRIRTYLRRVQSSVDRTA